MQLHSSIPTRKTTQETMEANDQNSTTNTSHTSYQQHRQLKVARTSSPTPSNTSSESSASRDPATIIEHSKAELTDPNQPTITKYIQTTFTQWNKNLPFGDLLTNHKPKNSIRVVLQNVNGIYKAKSWTELNKLAFHLKELQIDVFSAVETNITWNLKYNNIARATMRKHIKQCSITTSSNTEKCITSYQPGGTLTTIMNQYTGRITGVVNDKSTLERWSGYSLRTNFNTLVHFISVYQPTKSDGIHSTFKQHTHYYNNQGIVNPDPRKILLQDLTNTIQRFNKVGDKTIIMIDATTACSQTIHFSRNFYQIAI
jgi:hypothetical protein